MNKIYKYIRKSYFYIFLISTLFPNWGFYAHKRINYYAIFTLKKANDGEMLFSFFKKHIHYMVNRSIVPDIRKIYTKHEKEKHFINFENYGEEIIQQEYVSYNELINVYAYNVAKKLYPNVDEKELDQKIKTLISQSGINPWAISYSMEKLIKNFKEKNVKKILEESINLAHYIGDSCVVFHATANYDGQNTGQRGIHSLWESTLPEYFFEEYNITEDIVPKAEYIENYKIIAWQNTIRSYLESKKALEIERQLNEKVTLGKFCYKARGQNVKRMHSKNYAKEYHRRLNGQVKQQIIKAIELIGSFIYTAWVEAGKPNLIEESSAKNYSTKIFTYIINIFSYIF